MVAVKPTIDTKYLKKSRKQCTSITPTYHNRERLTLYKASQSSAEMRGSKKRSKSGNMSNKNSHTTKQLKRFVF